MRNALMCLTDEAINLLAEVAVPRRVYWVTNPKGSYAVNAGTGRRCTKLARALQETEAIQRDKPRDDTGPFTFDLELTDEGREALYWHRPGLRAPDNATSVSEGGADRG